VTLEVAVERERLPTLFLHDELRMSKGDAVTLTEGPLSVTVSLDLCDASTSCLSVMAAAASAVCGD
jgi:hypothetical protein